MTIGFEIPRDIEQELNARGAGLSQEAREAFLVEQYRQRKISHHQLGRALGLDDYETDGVLTRHGIWLEVSIEELKDAAGSLRDARPE